MATILAADRSHAPRSVLGRPCVLRLGAVLLGVSCLSLLPASGIAEAADAHADLPHAPHGTPFHFEVIDSHDAKYLGDTPAHVGKDGGLTVRPQVALGDSVYRTLGKTTKVVGTITQVLWDRVSGSLTVEFDPQPFERIAVGDEVWIDLNPLPKPPAAVEPGTTPTEPGGTK